MKEERSILIVEDDEAFRESLRKVLEKEGFQVLEASSGEKGLDALKNGRIDLVILDLYLGGITGLEFLDRANQPGRPPVIMLTAFCDWGVYEEAVRKGALDCLPKPVKRSELMTVIGKAFSKNQIG